MRRGRGAAEGRRTVLIANPGTDLYGSDRMMLETAEAMRAVGWRVVVSIPPGDGPLVAELRGRDLETLICPTPVVRKSALSARGLLALAAEFLRGVPPAVRAIRRVCPEVVYVSTVTPPLWLLVARLLHRRTVCHVHESETGPRRFVLRGLNAPLFFAHELVINSEFSRQVLLSIYPRLDSRLRVIYNAVSRPEPMVEARRDLAAPYRLLFVGRLSTRKGPHVAIEAVQRLRDAGEDVILDLVGAVFPGYEWFERELVETVERLGLQSQVRFHGYQPTAWAQLDEADIAIVPSTVDEPFGNTAVEAVLSARPLVVSDLAGLKEAAGGVSAAVRVPAGDPDAIAAAVRHIADDWIQLREAAVRDAAIAAERYSVDRYGEEIRAVLTERRLLIR